MRKLLMSSTCLLWAFSANAADNAVTVTNGTDINLKSKDLGAGLQLMQHGILDTAGNEILGLLTASPAATSISGRLVTINTSLSTINTTLGTPFQAGGSIGNTTFAATQGTSPWIIAGTAASGAALSGNPVRVGLSDGTNAVNWLTSSAIADGATGTGMAAVGNHVWNGTTWDRMPGTTAGLTVLSPVAANFLTTATLNAETTKIIGTVNIAAGQSIVVTQGTASNLNATVVNAGTFAVQLTGSTNNINNISGTVTLPTLAATSTKQSDGTQKTQIVDGAGAVIASTSNNLNVQCANCSGSGVSTADEASFTAGASLFAGGGGFFQTTATSNALTTGQQGMFQVTATRALFTNLRNAAGTEVGTSTTPLQVSVANTGANGTAMLVTGTGGTFPVTATNLSTNIAQMNGVTVLMGNGVTGTGSQRVTIASDNTAFSVNAAATLAAETTKVIGTVRNVGNIGGVTDFIGQNAATPANAWLVGCGFNTTPTTITTGNSSPLQCDSGGKLLVTATVTATNLSTNVAQMNGVAVTMGNGVSGTGVQRVVLASDGTAISTAGYMSVKIDQTTVGTTNAISLAQINAATTLAGNGATGTGAQRVTIANDNTLPTGWASSVAIASTTSGQTGPLAQCAVTTASPTYTTAQTDPLSCDTTGGLRTNPGTAASWGIGATGAALPANAQLAGFSDGTNTVAARVGAVANVAAATGIQQVLGVAQYNATPLTVTDTRYQSLQSDINGNLRVNVTNANSNGQASMTNSSPVVIASNQSALAVTVGALATGGSSTTGNIAANNTTAVVVKAAAGTLYGVQVYGLGSAPAYLKIYNATSATCGSGVPVKRIMIPAASTAANGAGSNIAFGTSGVAFGTGITYCVTTGIADNDTTAPAAATFLINVDWT